MEHALFSLALLLIIAKVSEGVAARLGLSSLVAYVFTGIVLGPVIGLVDATPELSLFFNLGVFFLFFLIGVEEIDIEGFVATLRGRFFIASVIAFAVPLLSSFFVLSWLLDLPTIAALAVAGVIALSSLGVAAKVLSDLGHLKEPLGMEIFTTVVMVELMGLLLVGFTLQGGTFAPLDVLLVGTQMAAFAVTAWVLASYVFPPLVMRLQRILGISELPFGLIVGALLLTVVGAEAIGLHGSLGALLFGIALSSLPHRLRAEVMPGIRSAAQGLFVPLFFAAAGLHLDLSFLELPPFTIAAVVLVSVLTKFAGAALGAYVTRLGNSIAIASGLMAKGVVEIALLVVMLEADVISGAAFSLLTIIMLGYIFVVPPIIRVAVNRTKGPAIGSDHTGVMGGVIPFFARYALESMTVAEAMQRSLQFSPESVTVKDFAEKWVVPEQQDYIVVQRNDEGRDNVIGVLPLRRIQRVPKDEWATTTIGALVRQRFHRAWPEESLDDALERMTEHGLSVIPVVDPQSGALIGSLHSRDIFALMLGEASESSTRARR